MRTPAAAGRITRRADKPHLYPCAGECASPRGVRVLLAEDYPLLRHGFRSLFEREGLEVVGEADDGREAVRLALELTPDVAVLDVIMPGLNGIDAVREIVRNSPATRCVLLSRHVDNVAVLSAVRAGASGYFLKTVSSETLFDGIRQIRNGAACFCPEASRILSEACTSKRPVEDEILTRREREILQLIAEGRTSKEIANLLSLSVKTAESHRMRVADKLNIRTTAGLVRYAIRRGLVEP